MKTPLTIPYNQPSMVFVIKFLAKTLLKFISHYSQPQCVNFGISENIHRVPISSVINLSAGYVLIGGGFQHELRAEAHPMEPAWGLPAWHL